MIYYVNVPYARVHINIYLSSYALIVSLHVRAKPQEANREVVCPSGSIVATPAVVQSACFTDGNIRQWSLVIQLFTNCYQFIVPRGMDGLIANARPRNWIRARQTCGARNQAARDRIIRPRRDTSLWSRWWPEPLKGSKTLKLQKIDPTEKNVQNIQKSSIT